MILLDQTTVKGLYYYSFDKIADQIQVNDLLTLVPEPENQHDRFAVKVLWDDQQIGHISRYKSQIITALLQHGFRLHAIVTKVDKNLKICDFDLLLDNSD